MNYEYRDDSEIPVAVYDKNFYEVHEVSNICSDDGTIGVAYSARDMLFDNKAQAERYAKTGKLN